MSYWSYRKKKNSEWWKENKEAIRLTALFIGYICLMIVTSITIPYFFIQPSLGLGVAVFFAFLITMIFIAMTFVIFDYFYGYKDSSTSLYPTGNKEKKE